MWTQLGIQKPLCRILQVVPISLVYLSTRKAQKLQTRLSRSDRLTRMRLCPPWGLARLADPGLARDRLRKGGLRRAAKLLHAQEVGPRSGGAGLPEDADGWNRALATNLHADPGDDIIFEMTEKNGGKRHRL